MALFDKQDHFKMPFSFIEWAEPLTDAEKGRLVQALVTYCKSGIVPELYGASWNVWQRLQRYVDYQESHPRWRGGNLDNPQRDRSTQEYQNWRTAVFIRDNYTCQKCGRHGGKLNAHHIKRFSNYPELRYLLSNGITLCEDCHREEHRRR